MAWVYEIHLVISTIILQNGLGKIFFVITDMLRDNDIFYYLKGLFMLRK